MLSTIPKNSKKTFSFCEKCFEKQCKIDRLEDENRQLKQKVKALEKRNEEGYFGSSTPSSKKPFKENTKPVNKKRNGGAKKGHKGYGRKTFKRTQADEIKYLQAPKRCEDCGSELISKGTEDRAIIDTEPIKVKKILFICEESYCPICNKWITAKPIALNKSLYGNQLLTQTVVRHYLYGIPVGKIEKIFGNTITRANLHNIFHRLAKIFEPAIDRIIKEYRKEQVKHADETGWRTDGENGYAWLFCSKDISIFKFAKTRSGKIAREVLGEKKSRGYLIVDRYKGYNSIKCKKQYCYAHLLRDIKEYGEKYPEKEEVQNFVNTFKPYLSEAMGLRSQEITDEVYYRKAEELKEEMLKTINHPAKDFGIQNIQMTFKENEKKLYHWVENRNVPAENNKAERELRSTVISRKVSFGSQSDKGAKTRSILMTVLHTAQKRLKNRTVEDWLKQALDKISKEPTIDPYLLIPPPYS